MNFFSVLVVIFVIIIVILISVEIVTLLGRLMLSNLRIKCFYAKQLKHCGLTVLHYRVRLENPLAVVKFAVLKSSSLTS